MMQEGGVWLRDCVNKTSGDLYVVRLGPLEKWIVENRNRFQDAILTLDDDILGLQDKSLLEVINSPSFAAIVATLGTGPKLVDGVQLDLSKLRYSRIMIATDSMEKDRYFIESIIQLLKMYFDPVLVAKKVLIAKFDESGLSELTRVS